jgi:hypothetical protein
MCINRLDPFAAGVVPGLSPLIQALPTLRRVGDAAARGRLRRNSNTSFFTQSRAGLLPHPHQT